MNQQNPTLEGKVKQIELSVAGLLKKIRIMEHLLSRRDSALYQEYMDKLMGEGFG